MTPTPLRVRNAVEADAPALANIRIRGWRAAYRGIVPGQILARLSVKSNTAFFVTRIATPGAAETLVIESEPGVPRGYALTGPCGDDDGSGLGEIQAIYLDPDARGRGLGDTLLGHAISRLAEADFASIVLWVLTANGPARRFYERHGFALDGAARMLDFDGTPIQEIRYRRTIAGPTTIEP